jgi:hypothetical protein
MYLFYVSGEGSKTASIIIILGIRFFLKYLLFPPSQATNSCIGILMTVNLCKGLLVHTIADRVPAADMEICQI